MERTGKINTKYALLQSIYWIGSCALIGYSALYLQFKGVSNTLIGVVAGGAAFASILVSTVVASLTEQYRILTLKQMILLLNVIIGGIFFLLTVWKAPTMWVMVLYFLMITINSCFPALLSSLGMAYMNCGMKLNFGLARGMGSAAYAVMAMVLGRLLERFRPDLLGYVFCITVVFFVITGILLPETGMTDPSTEKAEIQTESTGKIFIELLKNKTMLLLMLGFCLCVMIYGMFTTYMVNINRYLGGTETTLGIATFVAALSEMPVMFLYAHLQKKFSSSALLKASAVFFFLRIIVLIAAKNIPMMIGSMLLQGPGFGLFYPASVAYVNQALPDNKRIRGQAIFGIVTSNLASGCGNLLGGYLQDTIGVHDTLYVCAFLTFVGMVLILMIPGQEKERQARFLLNKSEM